MKGKETPFQVVTPACLFTPDRMVPCHDKVSKEHCQLIISGLDEVSES